MWYDVLFIRIISMKEIKRLKKVDLSQNVNMAN